MSMKTAPSLSTIERVLGEVDEWYARIRRLRQELVRLKRGSPAYLDLLPELEAELGVLKNKADWAARLLEEYEESLPDDDGEIVATGRLFSQELFSPFPPGEGVRHPADG